MIEVVNTPQEFSRISKLASKAFVFYGRNHQIIYSNTENPKYYRFECELGGISMRVAT